MRRPFVLLLLALVGCPVGNPTVYLPPAGLYTFPSDTTKAPKGAFAQADDVVIDKEGLLESRPGFPPYRATFPFGSGSNRARKMYWYGGFPLVLADTSPPTLAYHDGSNWNAYSGTFKYPDDVGSGGVVRPVGIEASGNFYLSTASGIQMLDQVGGVFKAAGVPTALDISSSLSNANGGFLAANSQVAYRAVWGIRDANQNLKLGAVSARASVINPSGQSYVAGTLSKSGSSVVTATSPAAHGLQTGQFVTVVFGGAEANFTAGTFAVTVTNSTHFTYNDGGASPTATNAQTDTITPTSTNVSVKVRIPGGITMSHFLQVYRTAQSIGATVDPGDAEQQIYEYAPTATDLSTGTITFTDIADDGIRGAALYTNSSQEGIAATNTPPPLAFDMALFKDCLFLFRTEDVSRMTLNLLGTGVPNGSFVYFTAASALDTFGLTASTSAENTGTGTFLVYSSGTPAQNIANTAQSFVRVINAYSANTWLSAAYASGPDDAPGIISLFAKTPGYAFAVAASSGGSLWSPALDASVVTASNANPPHTQIHRTSNVVTVEHDTSHAYSVGQTVWITNGTTGAAADPAFPFGAKTILSVVANVSFTYAEVGANGNMTTGANFWITSNPANVGSASIAPNSVMWSKPRQPEAIPLSNNARPGSNTKAILRGVALRNSMFIFKEDGLYRLTGDYPNWNIQLFDPTVKVLLPESVRTLANQIYALTDQGIARISDSGVEIISRPIENLLPKNIDNTNLTPYGFAITRESKHEYILFFNPAGGTPSNALRYNAFTNTWTRWTIPATAAVVDPVADNLYLASGTTNGITKDTRAGNFLDYYDGFLTVSVSSQNLAAKTVTLVSAAGVNVGDTLGDGTPQYSVITAVNGNVLTLNDAFTWQASPIVYGAINSVVQWAPQNAGQPMVFKRWIDVTGDFKQAAFTSMTETFSSELSTTGASVTLPGTSALTAAGVSQPIRTWCTAEAARSNQLNIKIAIKNALAVWQLRGIEIEYRMNAGASR